MPVPLFRRSGGGDAVDSHIGAQGFGDQNRAVGLLIIFDNGDPGASDSETGAVQCVYKIAFAAGFWLVANAGAARLKRCVGSAAGGGPRVFGGTSDPKPHQNHIAASVPC